MSKNRNRAKYNNARNQKEFNILFKKDIYSYCYICQKRSGSWFWDCHPSNLKAKHRHGNGRIIESYKFRSFKTWKHNRKYQWKETKINWSPFLCGIINGIKIR